MKMIKNILVAVLVLSTIHCKKDKTPAPVNVTLYDKPLSVIQSYVVGKWRLQYEHGGICGTCVYPVRNSPFLILTKDSIKIGDDSAGVIVNAGLNWINGYNGGYDVSFYYAPWFGTYPINYLILKIHNDTLQLRDDINDAMYYEYTRFN